MLQKLKKPLRWLIAVLSLLLGLTVLGLLFRDSILKLAAQKSLQASTGMRVEIARFKTSWRSPAIQMQGFKLHNYPEFGDSVLLDVPELFVEFDSELAS